MCVCVCVFIFVCVCVVIPFTLDVRYVDVPAGVTQDFSTFLLRCLPSFFSQEGCSFSFPSSTMKTHFVYYRFSRSPLVGALFFYFFIFFVRKNPSSFDDTEIRTHVPSSEGFEVTP